MFLLAVTCLYGVQSYERAGCRTQNSLLTISTFWSIMCQMFYVKFSSGFFFFRIKHSLTAVIKPLSFQTSDTTALNNIHIVKVKNIITKKTKADGTVWFLRCDFTNKWYLGQLSNINYILPALTTMLEAEDISLGVSL